MKCPNCDIRNDMEDNWYGESESHDVTYEDVHYNNFRF